MLFVNASARLSRLRLRRRPLPEDEDLGTPLHPAARHFPPGTSQNPLRHLPLPVRLPEATFARVLCAVDRIKSSGSDQVSPGPRA
jgi:hypothetical protein